jgi:hypothetical protein
MVAPLYFTLRVIPCYSFHNGLRCELDATHEGQHAARDDETDTVVSWIDEEMLGAWGDSTTGKSTGQGEVRRERRRNNDRPLHMRVPKKCQS